MGYRKRLASEILRPAFSRLDSLIETISVNLTAAQGTQVIDLLCDLFRAAVSWADGQPDKSDVQTVKVTLRSIDLRLSRLTSDSICVGRTLLPSSPSFRLTYRLRYPDAVSLYAFLG